MALDSQSSHRTVVEGEFRALQALCQDSEREAFRKRALVLLADYRFRDPLHQLVFDSLRALLPAQSKDVRAALVQRLTTLGFPDVDLDPFFQPYNLAAETILSIMEQLAGIAHGELRPQAGAG